MLDENEISWIRDQQFSSRRGGEDKSGENSAKASIITVDANQDRLSFVTRDKMDDFNEPSNPSSPTKNDSKRIVQLILTKSKSLNVKHARLNMSYRMQSLLDQSPDNSSVMDAMQDTDWP